MKIKDIWNIFLEPRKSPTCNAIVFVGFMEIFFVLIPFIILSMCWPVCLIASIFAESKLALANAPFACAFVIWPILAIQRPMLILLHLMLVITFISEMIFHIKMPSDFLKDNKKYKLIWKIGTISFIISRALWVYFHF